MLQLTFCCYKKHPEQESNLGTKGFISRSRFQSIIEEAKAGIQGRSLKWKPQRNTASWLVLRPAFSHFSYTSLTCLPGDGAASSDLGIPTLIINQDNESQTDSHTELMEANLQLRLSLSTYVKLSLIFVITANEIGKWS